MHKIAKYTSQFVGAVFLLSSFAKAADSAYFAHIIALYGWPPLQYTAPLIISAEIILGLLLIFQQRLRWTAFLSLFFIGLLTAVYSYGLFFNKITDCGCFGHIDYLSNSPVFIYTRNVILCGLLFIAWKYGDNNPVRNWKLGAVFCLTIGVIMFLTGYTTHFQASSSKPNFKAYPLNESTLSNYVNTSPDSTYMIFLFSFTCPHCINSIGNVEQYERFGLVDKVIGIAPTDTVAERNFRDVFTPAFDIYTFPIDTIIQLSNSMPKTYYIRHDSIISIYDGELPSAYFNIK